MAGPSKSASQRASRSEPQPDDRKHILLEPYCLLCRDTLLYQKYWLPSKHEPEELLPWKVNVFCFFEYFSAENVSAPRRVHFFRGNLTDEEWIRGHLPTQKVLEEAKSVLCYLGCKDCDSEVTANLIHENCLLLMKAKLQDVKISATLLYKVARHLRPMVEWRRALALGINKKPPAFSFPGDHSNTELNSVVSAVGEKLPWEIQGLIASQITDTLVLSLSRCLATLESVNWQQLLSQDVSQSGFDHSFPFSSIKSVPARLGAKTIDILGETCLVSIGSEGPLDLEIPIADRPIRGVERAFGLHGIVGFRLLYVDGPPSPWLGTSWRRWLAETHGDNLQKLRVVTDGFKAVSMTMGEDSPESHFQMIWNQQNLSKPPGVRHYGVDSATRRLKIRGNPNAKFGDFLPLDIPKCHSNQLTLYCDGLRIFGVQLNDKPKLGPRGKTCCIITHHLQYNDTVDALHVLIKDEKETVLFQGPHVLLCVPYPHHSKKQTLEDS